MRWNPVKALASFLLSIASVSTGMAANYPEKPVSLIVPFTPGGVPDVLARMIAQHLTGSMGQPVVVDNRAGAGGTLGTAIGARAAPNGYTLTMAMVSTNAINEAIYKNIAYKSTRDFAPISLVATVPNVLVVNPRVSAKSVNELIAAAKKEPGKYAYASGGAGTSLHMSGALFARMAGIELLHVPYKGNAPALTDVVSGQIPMMFSSITSALPFIKNGRLRALGVTTLVRSEALPEVPTISEEGLKGYEMNPWFGILAPAGTPASVIEKLSSEIAQMLELPAVKARLIEIGAQPLQATPAQFADLLKTETTKWAKLVQAEGIKASE